MLATAIIVFREVLEAALVVGIVLAASKGVRDRLLWVGGGIFAGIAGACLVAFFAETIADAAAGIGQELLNATILFLAVAMLGWHNIWMGRHGRELAQQAAELGKSVTRGTRPLYALTIVVGMAVLREGSELVLFLYSIAAGGGGGLSNMAGGGALGLIAGIGVGAALYFGLLPIPTKHLFAVTSWLILLLAAGMASQAAAFLVQADILPALSPALWDTSWLLNEDSIPGKVMHALVGYVARPAGIQLVFWAGTLLAIGLLMRLTNRGPMLPKRPTSRAAGVAAVAVLTFALAVGTAALAIS
jgi:high-affinity iron transporter